MSIPIPNISTSSASEASGRIGPTDSAQRLESAGGVGNRGFVNNFAAEGSSLRADDINGPAWNPKRLLLWVAVIGALGALGWLIWKRTRG